MECLFLPGLKSDTVHISIIGEEFKHLWALRLKIGESIMLSNGNGICAISQLIKISKTDAVCTIIELIENYGENKIKKGLGLGILDSRDRMEIALEKSVELGITDFYPIICEFSQKKTISIERFHNKAIAALKQCKRAFLPIIHNPMTLNQILDNSSQWKTLFIGDATGKQITKMSQKESALVLIGTEGGFSASESKLLNDDSRTIRVTLANRRLRAETAAIVALSLLSNLND